MQYLTSNCLWVLILFCSSSGHGFVPVQQEPSWETYSSKSEEFSVLLPEQPTKITVFRPQGNPLEKPKAPGRMYGAYSDGVVYLILSFDNPNHKEPLEVFIDEIRQYPINGRAETFEREIRLDGFSGKQYRFGSPTLSGVVRFYTTKSHVYIVEATSDRVITGREATRKALVVAKPEPSYTEEARQRQITGTVVLRGVFASSGRVTGLRVLSGLSHGLRNDSNIQTTACYDRRGEKVKQRIARMQHLPYRSRFR